MTEDLKVNVAHQLQIVEKATPYRTYKYRWTILGLYFLVSLSSAFQWPTYVIIDNVIEQYYEIALETVNVTATVFLICYVVFIFPATYLLQKYGLRFAVTMAAVGPCVASLLKLLSVRPERFWIVLLSQAIIGTTQTYVTVLPASVAAAWFGPDQVSTACSIASAGIQIAIAAGCLIPSLLLDGEVRKDYVESKLVHLNTGIAAFSSFVLVLIVLFFRAEPPTPPSESRQKLKNTANDLTKSIKQITSDVPFVLFWLGYSSHIGIFYTLCFLLNPTVIRYYPKNASDVGTMGLLFMTVGVIGAAIFGIILDKFRRFKETAVLANLFSSICLIAFTVTLEKGLIYLYIFQTMIGFFMTAAVSVGLEVGAEITYPLPENVSSGFLLIGTKLLGFIFTTIFSIVFNKCPGIWAHLGMSAIVVAATILTIIVPFRLNRQEALCGQTAESRRK